MCSSWFVVGTIVLGAAALVVGWRIAVKAKRSFNETAVPVSGKVIRVDRHSGGEGGSRYTAILEMPGERFAAEVNVPPAVAKQVETGSVLTVHAHPRKQGRYVHGDRTFDIVHPVVVAIWGGGFIVFGFGLVWLLQVTFYSSTVCV